MSLHVNGLTCDHLTNPMGIDSPKPVLAWKIESDERGVMQKSYQILISEDPSFGSLVWDSGMIESDRSIGISYEGRELASVTEYFWKVTVKDNKGSEAASDTAAFETAFMNKEDWKAKWAEPVQEAAFEEPVQIDIMGGGTGKRYEVEELHMLPAKMVRKDFVLSKQVKKARVYATAHGVYYLEINGQKVGDIELAPGHTTYHQYISYQTYDITGLLTKENAIGAVIGDGWYAGKNGITGCSVQYGDTLSILFQIEIEYEDGTKETICSDETCTGTQTSPIIYSDLYVGEGFDASKAQTGFSSFGYKGEEWQPVQIKEYGYETLHAQYGEPVRSIDKIQPIVFTAPNGDIMLDAGQVLTGWTVMKVIDSEGAFRGTSRGKKITLEHTESLDKEGNYLQNIIGKFCLQQDTYICSGQAEETFTPRFTYHGFRYVRIKGYPGMPKAENFEIQVLCSDMPAAGEFTCSDQRLNQLQHNILWSQKSNMLSVPTDCPQREKAGWTGDAQIFAPTSFYNMGCEAFWKLWLRNMQKDQQEDGQIPNVVPYLKAYHPGIMPIPGMTHCSAGWGDAAVIVPWALYRAYGDKEILADNYGMMRKWVEYIRHTASEELPSNLQGKDLSSEDKEVQKYLWNTNFHFGDWLTPSVSFNFETGDVDMIASAFKTMDIVPTCFYAYSTRLMQKIAVELGKPEDARYYEDLNEKVKWAFRKEYVDENGYIKTELQGIYVLALQMDLIPSDKEENAVNKLLEMIRDNGGKLDTGFLSTPFLMDVLQKKGRLKDSYDLLFQDGCPSWLYEVKMGATTMWEAWQAILPDGTPTSVSYNHYAFGCVGDWIYRNVAGIEAKTPGYKVSLFKPEMDARLTSAKGSYDSVYGRLVSDWEISGGKMTYKVTVPANTTAEIMLPCSKIAEISEGGKSLSEVKGITGIHKMHDKTIVTTGSGSYVFTYAVERTEDAL